MRQITSESVQAFNEGKVFSKGNMSISVGGDSVVIMRLHGNCIAMKDSGGLFITSAGWMSNTTKERLNGLKGVSIVQKNFVWFLNGVEWDGSLIKVS